MSDRCPYCSYCPTSMNDYCDEHRPRAWLSPKTGAEIMTLSDRKAIAEKAREATTILRDHARIHGMHFRERDPLVMAIHAAIDQGENDAPQKQEPRS